MNRWITSLEKRLYFAENVICSICLLVMLLTVALGVCVRVFNWPIPNVAEWALAAMSPLTFVGSAMCAHKGAHIAVDIIEQLPFPLIKRISAFIVAALMVIFSVVYAWLGWSLFEDALITKERWLDMGTPVFIPIFFFFIGMVFMSIHGLCDLIRGFLSSEISPNSFSESVQ